MPWTPRTGNEPNAGPRNPVPGGWFPPERWMPARTVAFEQHGAVERARWPPQPSSH